MIFERTLTYSLYSHILSTSGWLYAYERCRTPGLAEVGGAWAEQVFSLSVRHKKQLPVTSQQSPGGLPLGATHGTPPHVKITATRTGESDPEAASAQTSGWNQ